MFKFNTLVEKYFESRKPIDGYVDASELLGQRLWVHTNRTHRNQGYNGMLGIYGINSKGHKVDPPLYYTNEIRLKNPIVFQASEEISKRIQETGKRTLAAGVSGVISETEGNLSGFSKFDYLFEVGYFFDLSDPEKKKIIGADEVYFSSTEDGKYIKLVKNPKFENIK
jgi:hypothetical protein